MTKEVKTTIEQNIKDFKGGDLRQSTEKLLNTLGYNSNKKADIDLESLKIRASEHNIEKVSYALWNEWISASLVFQITAEEIRQNTSLSDFNTVEDDLMQSYLFFAIELKGNYYTRGQLSGITRFMNRLYDMPVMVLFRYDSYITFAIINRRPCKIDSEKSVLEKITLIKDVSVEVPHRAHIEILYDLSLEELQHRHGFSDFMGLHEAWQKTLDTKELNKQFYQKLFNWYLWSLRQVKFPQIRPKDEMIPDNVHQSESLIRLLTRLLFVWFMKEKGLITPDLFDHKKLKSILKDFKGSEGSETIYYKAILQNLFFATLNRKIEQRKPIDKKKFPNPEYGDPLVYRYEDLFIHPDNILTYFKDIPFLNGGLFDCLDQKKDGENKEEIRLDGFSTKKEKQPVFPDKLFFGEYNDIDLSTDYDDKRKNHQTVFGLIDILQQYKFTIEENTPVEEEVALDPELLGKVFENLLASYNPETQTTARKQTGSFYTPREIVNYMVDESLIAYLKNHVDDEERLRKLFSYENGDNGNPFDERETGILLKAIDNCKILDPACGSGAFPMGVLQKMIHILHKLDHDNSRWFEMVINNFPPYMQSEVRKKLEKENWNYVRKLGIIQQCIYGVDIQPIATQIAKLRFFISLLVDQKEKPGEENRGFEPLPNLDFKIVTANTLIPAPASDAETTGLFAGQADPFFEEFDKLTALYFSTYDTDKKKGLKNKITGLITEKCNQKIKEIESKFEHPDENASKALKVKYKKFIEEKEQEVKLWKSYANLFKYESVGFFEPKYFFPKAKDGFDVVIGNPPYVSALELKKLISETEYKYLKTNFCTAKGTVDFYIYFFEKGIKLLNKNGLLAYISPNRYLSASYGEELRKYIFNNTTIYSIVDYSDVRIFEEASTYPILSFIRKGKVKNYEILIGTFDNTINSLRFRKTPSDKLNFTEGYIWGFLLNEKIEITEKVFAQSVPISKACHINSSSTASEAADYHYLINENGGYKLINTGTIDRYINTWGIDYLTDKGKKYKNPYLPKSSNKISNNRRLLYSSQKIIFAKIALRVEAFYDDKGEYASINTNCFHSFSENFNPKYILTWVNSNLFQFVFECFFDGLKMQGGYLLYSSPNLLSMVIKDINKKDQEPFIKICDYVIYENLKVRFYTFFEQLVDALFYELYFPEKIETANCKIIRYLSDLPELREDWSDEKKLKASETVYKELSDPSHPVSIAMAKMQEIEEVKIIEGRV